MCKGDKALLNNQPSQDATLYTLIAASESVLAELQFKTAVFKVNTDTRPPAKGYGGHIMTFNCSDAIHQWFRHFLIS